MNLIQLLEKSTIWFTWGGIALTFLTIIAFLARWGIKFRLIGTTVFTLLLAASTWVFSESYTPPIVKEGAKYAPIVYDNGSNLVVAQVPNDFPNESIQPTLDQIAANLKGGSRNKTTVRVRMRTLQPIEEGITQPIILGEVTRDLREKVQSPYNEN